MKKFCRGFSLFLALALCLSLLPVGALAEAEEEHIHEEVSDVTAQLVAAEEIAVETGEEEAVVSVDAEMENEEVLSSECDHVYGEFLEPNYTECNGGWKIGFYSCELCNASFDEDYNELDWEAFYAESYEEGTGEHIISESAEADYTECGGGWKVDRYWCGVCNKLCDENGATVDWETFRKENYAEGTGEHTPGEFCLPDYTECGGGLKVGYYWCEDCGVKCDKAGAELDWDAFWDENYAEGTGDHIAGEYIEAYYTECGGGWKAGRCWCEVCGTLCDTDGNELDWDAFWDENYVEGTGIHTPDKYVEADYTECGGGLTKGYYECGVCSRECDEKGNELDWDAFREENYVEGTGIHTPDKYVEADYTECGGGLTKGYYECGACARECDEKGNEFDWSTFWETYYKEGEGAHTPGEFCRADYTECSGGYTEGFYWCDVCGDGCNFDGTTLDWDAYEEQYYKEGTGKHTPGKMARATYTECGGGWIVDHYRCTLCQVRCDEDGVELDWETDYRDGNGSHTAGTYWEADYTECGGGLTEGYYTCSVCESECDKNGKDYFPGDSYQKGNGKHTPGKRIKATYTECGGGLTVDYYRCTVCKTWCDEDGAELDWETAYEDGNGKHTPGKCWKPDYTECNGGVTVEYYSCSVCGIDCTKSGEKFDWELNYKAGNGKHTAGLLFKADYTECSGGWTIDYYGCEICGFACDKDGVELESGYRGGTGKHTPGEYVMPQTTECGGGYTDAYYICAVCGTGCDEDGRDLYMDEMEYSIGNGKHTPGEFCRADYTKCGGGLIVDYYTCSECGVECDEDGHDLDWDKVHIEGDYKHTPGERCEANYQKCTGGWTEDFYLCKDCGEECDEDGNEIWMLAEMPTGHVYTDGVCIHCGGLAGDLTEDGVYDPVDLVCLMKRVLGNRSDEALWSVSDVNTDGKTDILDIVNLLRKMAG